MSDASALPFPSCVSDLTLCSFAAGYIRDLSAAIAEMARITRRGGQVIISDLHPAAIAAGWTRSFRASDVVYEIEHASRSAEEILEDAFQCGLELEAQHSACFGEPERPIFEAAGKAEAFEELAKTPAVWIGVWTKP